DVGLLLQRILQRIELGVEVQKGSPRLIARLLHSIERKERTQSRFRIGRSKLNSRILLDHKRLDDPPAANREPDSILAREHPRSAQESTAKSAGADSATSATSATSASSSAGLTG